MTKRKKRKVVQISVSDIQTRAFLGKDLNAFEQGNISAEELLSREKITPGKNISIPPEERQLLKNSIKDLESGSKCVYPECKETPIEAHMLSRANWLDVLSENDAVLKINEAIHEGKTFLSEVPLRRASIERCLCAKHDYNLFQVLDASGYAVSAEWLFKSAYRLLCGRKSVPENFLSIIENYQQALRNAGIPVNHDPSFYDLKSHSNSQLEHIRVKKLMDKALLEENWDIMESNYWEIPTEKPTVAAAGVSSLNDVCQRDRNNDKVLIFVVAIPKKDKTLIVVSSMRENSEAIRSYMDRIGILERSGENPETWPILSKLLLRYCRYICINPVFLETKPENEWKKMLSYWYITKSDFFYDLKYKSDEALNLFR